MQPAWCHALPTEMWLAGAATGCEWLYTFPEPMCQRQWLQRDEGSRWLSGMYIKSTNLHKYLFLPVLDNLTSFKKD